jgi:hypothetical protein
MHRQPKILADACRPALQAAARSLGRAPMHGIAMKKTTTTKTTSGGACAVSFG